MENQYINCMRSFKSSANEALLKVSGGLIRLITEAMNNKNIKVLIISGL